MDNFLTLNQNIEIIDGAVSQHLNDIRGNIVFHMTYNTKVNKQYRLSYYTDHQDGYSVLMDYDGRVLHSAEIDDLGWISLRALSNNKTEIKIVDGFIELNPDISPNGYTYKSADLEARLKTKEAFIRELIDRLKVDGFLEEMTENTLVNNFPFVNQARIKELRSISKVEFDLSKLIKFCEEINQANVNGGYFSVAMLLRAVLDHIPPIFGQKTFEQVIAQHGERSFKEHMGHLDKSLRKIADSYLHIPIRKKETLPNQTQVNFSADLDVLLAEIVRHLK